MVFVKKLFVVLIVLLVANFNLANANIGVEVVNLDSEYVDLNAFSDKFKLLEDELKAMNEVVVELKEQISRLENKIFDLTSNSKNKSIDELLGMIKDLREDNKSISQSIIGFKKDLARLTNSGNNQSNQNIAKKNNKKNNDVTNKNNNLQKIIGKANANNDLKNNNLKSRVASKASVVEKPEKKKNTNAIALDEIQFFKKGLKLALQSDYSKAVVIFKAYTNRYPKGAYIYDSYYWLGEMYNRQGDNKRAYEYFAKVLDNKDNNRRKPESLYSMGFLDYKAGNLDAAEIKFRRLMRDFPDSNMVGLAEKALSKLALAEK